MQLFCVVVSGASLRVSVQDNMVGHGTGGHAPALTCATPPLWRRPPSAHSGSLSAGGPASRHTAPLHVRLMWQRQSEQESDGLLNPSLRPPPLSQRLPAGPPLLRWRGHTVRSRGFLRSIDAHFFFFLIHCYLFLETLFICLDPAGSVNSQSHWSHS